MVGYREQARLLEPRFSVDLNGKGGEEPDLDLSALRQAPRLGEADLVGGDARWSDYSPSLKSRQK